MRVTPRVEDAIGRHADDAGVTVAQAGLTVFAHLAVHDDNQPALMQRVEAAGRLWKNHGLAVVSALAQFRASLLPPFLAAGTYLPHHYRTLCFTAPLTHAPPHTVLRGD